MKKRKIEVPLQNGKELKPIMIKPNMGKMIKPMAKFPDLSGDGKITKKDILMGRGVINKPKVQKTKTNLQKRFSFLQDAAKELQGPQGGNPETVKALVKSAGFGSNVQGTGKGSYKVTVSGNPVFVDAGGAFTMKQGKRTPYNKPNMYNKPKNKVKKDTPERLQIKKTGRELQNALIKEQNKPVTKQDKRLINQLQGAIEEQKKKLKNPTMYNKPKYYGKKKK